MCWGSPIHQHQLRRAFIPIHPKQHNTTQQTHRQESEAGEDDPRDEHGQRRHRQNAPQRALVLGLLTDLLIFVCLVDGLVVLVDCLGSSLCCCCWCNGDLKSQANPQSQPTHHREQVGLRVVDGGARRRLLDGSHGQRERELQGRVHGRGGAVDGEGLCVCVCVWGGGGSRRSSPEKRGPKMKRTQVSVI